MLVERKGRTNDALVDMFHPEGRCFVVHLLFLVTSLVTLVTCCYNVSAVSRPPHGEQQDMMPIRTTYIFDI